MSQNRRGLLVFAILGAGMLALPRIWPEHLPEIRGDSPEPGFRVLETGALSPRQDPFIGLNAPITDQPAPRSPTDLCAVLFRDGGDPSQAQIAYFTDANCPQCRAMERWFPGAIRENAQITTHDLPLLGPGSLTAARAVAAADMLGAGAAMRARLHRSRVQADPAYLREIAKGMGVDAQALLSKMALPETEARIADTLGAAARLGIPGTPALVIGELLVIGRIEEAMFHRLLAHYQPPPCVKGRS